MHEIIKIMQTNLSKYDSQRSEQFYFESESFLIFLIIRSTVHSKSGEFSFEKDSHLQSFMQNKQYLFIFCV